MQKKSEDINFNLNIFLSLNWRQKKRNNLSLGSNTALGVGNLDAERLGLGEDIDALAGGDGVADPKNTISSCI